MLVAVAVRVTPPVMIFTVAVCSASFQRSMVRSTVMAVVDRPKAMDFVSARRSPRVRPVSPRALLSSTSAGATSVVPTMTRRMRTNAGKPYSSDAFSVVISYQSVSPCGCHCHSILVPDGAQPAAIKRI